MRISDWSSDVCSSDLEKLEKALVQLPNLPHESVPAGSTAEDNEILHTHGDKPTLASEALPHWELAEKYDIIDFELGTKVTGAGFPVYRSEEHTSELQSLMRISYAVF